MMKKILFLVVVIMGCTEVEPKPSVSFSVEKLGGGEVQFVANAKNADVLKWDFGDERGWSGEVAKHQYQKNGNYNVTLVASGKGGDAISSQSITIDDVKGSVMFWMQAVRDKDIEVRVNGQTSRITGFYSSGTAPECGAKYCATFDRMQPGIYQFSAIELNSLFPTKWEGVVKVEGRGCVVQRLKY